MKILVTGSQGQLGWEILREAKSLGFETVGFDLPQIDITIKSDVEKVINNTRPDIVINAAGYTNVDRAEEEKEICFAVNCIGPGNIAAVCSSLEIPLIHISTDYVFDGSGNTPYTEKDIISPINAYGKCKAEGDDAVRNILQKHIIIRTSWLYGIHGHNFLKTILQLGEEKEVIEVVSDQFGSPTFATELANAVLTISSQIQNSSCGNWGTYNFCGTGITTWHGFAEKIIEEARKYMDIKTILVKPITSKEYPTKARRPYYSALDCSLMNRHFGIASKPWQESLKTAIKIICSNT
ncbi:MAG: dTDP-4-dehydrorhamnose reductase [Desulfobacterium sp.]|nr:dTDP-4-dehydrorhamnose reductase [Desulfobacterium sp.]MBU3949374.1 dTDP-4-dehydrorhamnose reductase [Pseudomonadota bacterium]MBU4035873.1 dTDP-4-dehydrorhamnose reductase [Pseudomonadota bacterium]